MALFESAFQHAKRVWVWGFVTEFVTLLLTVGAVFTEGAWTAALMLLVTGLLGVNVLLKLRRRGVLEQAEALRTRHLLAYGLGERLTEHDVQAYGRSFPAAVRTLARQRPPRTQPYYDTADTPGPANLLARLHESAFYSAEMANQAKGFYVWMITVPALLLVLALSGTALLDRDQGFDADVSQVMQAAVALISSLGLIETALTYAGLHRSLEAFLERLGNLRRGPPLSAAQVTSLVWEYAVMQAHGQLMPDTLWHRHGARIKEDWTRCEADLRADLTRRASGQPTG